MHRYVIVLISLLLIATSIGRATSPDTDRDRLLRLVPWQIDALARSTPECHPPDVGFIRADFDRDRSFRYVIASYSALCGTQISSAVRILRETNGQLLLYQIPSGLSFLAGKSLSADVVDLDNSGIPELLFRVRRGPDKSADYSLLLFQWRDGALQPISMDHIDTRRAVFRDLNADGRLELVPFDRCGLRKSRTGKRASSQQSGTNDPAHCHHTKTYFYRSGEFHEIEVQRAEARLSRLLASDQQFSLTELSQQRRGSPPHKEFVLQLAWPYDPAKPASLSNIKAETLLLGRDLHPETVITRVEGRERGCQGDSHSVPCLQRVVLEAQFNRAFVARLLPKLQLTKEIEMGDLVSVPLTALMENGDYISTNIIISISE